MPKWTTLASALAGIAIMIGATPSRGQEVRTSNVDQYARVGTMPDLAGIWSLDARALRGQPRAEASLTPAAQAELEAFRARQAAEGVSQEAQIRCLPPGMPRIMRAGYPMELLMTPDRLTILAEAYTQVRRIFIDGRDLPEDPEHYFNGTSVGRWEGDVLLVETVGFNPLISHTTGVTHGEQMRISERIWLLDADQMRIETTITDPGVLAAPLVSLAAYKRQPTWEMREYVCEENNRLTAGEGGANLDLEFDPNDPFGPPAE